MPCPQIVSQPLAVLRILLPLHIWPPALKPAMTADYSRWAAQIRRLAKAVAALEAEARALNGASPAGQEWYELLQHKLLSQVSGTPALVAAVVGGTNIGKSLVFNHLAGENASAVSPLAAGTKHPVCLVSADWGSAEGLARLFEGFTLRPWASPEDPLAAADEHLLFWRVGANVPPKLLLLDTPDVDSDAAVNWQRADAIRRSADVLVAVLTQQKYNDAAVKRFFRRAAEADKAVILVVNQVDLAEDREVWPAWIETFCRETGVRPLATYVVPLDRAGARTLTLSFRDVGPDGRSPPSAPADVRAELGALHFDRIKVRTLAGALGVVLDPHRGAMHWLDELRRLSQGFAAAEATLGASAMARVRWPSPPPGLLVDEIRAWWDERRSPFSKNINNFYRTLGRGLSYPVRAAWQWIGSDPTDPLVAYHILEREVIVEAVERLIGELERLAEVGNETLRPRLAALLTGERRGQLLARIEEAHNELPAVVDDYRAYLRGELDDWSQQNLRLVSWLQSADHAMALARPAITVTLAITGGAVAGGLVGPAAAHVAGHTASHLAAEAAIAGGVTVAGEMVGGAASEGLSQTAAQLFGRLQTHFGQMRAKWLADWLDRELLGGFLAELARGAGLAHGPQLCDVEQALAALARLQAEGGAATREADRPDV